MSEKKPDIKPYRLGDKTTLKLAMGDLTQFQGDAIVNAANEGGIGGGGVDGAIHRAAGPMLRKICSAMPSVIGESSVRIPTGKAIATRGFELDADIIIHTVGPVYEDDEESAPLLANAYRSSLDLAEFYQVRKLAFPAISCGIFGYPHGKAARIALRECYQGAKRSDCLEEIWFAFFERAVFRAFVEAADELLQPDADEAGEVGPAGSTDDAPASSSGPAEPSSAAAQDVTMTDSSAEAASVPPTAGTGSAALPLDHSGPPAAQPGSQQAMPAAGSLQQQVQAARAAQNLAGSSTVPASASIPPMTLSQAPMEMGGSMPSSTAAQTGQPAGMPTEASQTPGTSAPLGTGNIISQDGLVSCPGPVTSGAGFDPHTAPAGGVPKGTIAGLVHGAGAQDGTSPLGRVTGGSGTLPPSGTEPTGGPGELESLGARDASPARSSAAAALSSAQGFPGHGAPPSTNL